MTLVEKLQHLAAGSTPTAFGRRAGVPPTSVRAWLTGRGVPTVSHVLTIARTLDVDAEWMLDDAATLPVVPRGSRRGSPVHAVSLSMLLDHACGLAAGSDHAAAGERLARDVIRDSVDLLGGECLMNALAGVTVSVTRQLLIQQEAGPGRRLREAADDLARMEPNAQVEAVAACLIGRADRPLADVADALPR